MQNVTIISTEHRESGNCSSDELLKIIESINPDVIFEEETNDEKYQSFYNEKDSFKSLEVKTIIRYKQKHQIRNIPIDGKTNQYLSFQQWDYLFNTFKKYQAYNQIIKEHCNYRNELGFKYLNSERCIELFKRMKIVEEHIINVSGNEKELLKKTYDLFHMEHDLRENTMIKNIYSFSRENKINEAIFLLGYAHRQSIKKKILNFELEDNFKINWSFYNK